MDHFAPEQETTHSAPLPRSPGIAAPRSDIVEFIGAKALRDQRRREVTIQITQGQWDDMIAQMKRLADNLLKVTQLAAATQKRQAEMRADLIASGAFEKRSSIITPGDGR